MEDECSGISLWKTDEYSKPVALYIAIFFRRRPQVELNTLGKMVLYLMAVQEQEQLASAITETTECQARICHMYKL